MIFVLLLLSGVLVVAKISFISSADAPNAQQIIAAAKSNLPIGISSRELRCRELFWRDLDAISAGLLVKLYGSEQCPEGGSDDANRF